MSNTATTYSRSTKRTVKKQTAKRKARPKSTSRTPRPTGRQRSESSDPFTLPGWKDLHSKKAKNKKKRRSKAANAQAEHVSTSRFALFTLIAVIVLGFYVSHVFATQEALAVLHEAERENLRLTLEYNQKKASFDKLVSPDEVYRRAKALGLQEGTEFGPPILWKPENTD